MNHHVNKSSSGGGDKSGGTILPSQVMKHLQLFFMKGLWKCSDLVDGGEVSGLMFVVAHCCIAVIITNSE